MMITAIAKQEIYHQSHSRNIGMINTASFIKNYNVIYNLLKSTIAFLRWNSYIYAKSIVETIVEYPQLLNLIFKYAQSIAHIYCKNDVTFKDCILPTVN